MAGIYIHVPFCRTRCLYCDFFSNTRMDKKSAWLGALLREIELRRDYLRGEAPQTLYFGGGTPSQLAEADFAAIFDALGRAFDLSQLTEVTLEANPDDLSPEYIAMLRRFPFNRISMGVQSFDDRDLRFLNRRHDAERARRAVADCKAAGFDNISIDLMYGLPGQTLEAWHTNIQQAAALNVRHISAYHLIYEEGTAMHRLLREGKIEAVDEETSLAMFGMLIDELRAAGFEHYEISNFALPHAYSRHNTAYWQQTPYLGLGPGAHSFDGERRRHYNPGDLDEYAAAWSDAAPHPFLEEELLTDDDRYNELILTGLRTMWGVSLSRIRREFGEERLAYCLKTAAPHLADGTLQRSADTLRLTREGIFISDGIMADLLYVGEDF